MRTYDVLADVYTAAGQCNQVTERVAAISELAAAAAARRAYPRAHYVDVLTVVSLVDADQVETARGGLLARLALAAAGR